MSRRLPPLGSAVAALNPWVTDLETGRANKYGNRRTEGPNPAGGVRSYPSAREARRAGELMNMKQCGEIADFFPQVSLEYGEDENGNHARYVGDYMVIDEYLDDGRFIAWIEDPKGRDTEASKAKRAALRARGLNVRLV